MPDCLAAKKQEEKQVKNDLTKRHSNSVHPEPTQKHAEYVYPNPARTVHSRATIASAIRKWARGNRSSEAGVELLIRPFGGSLLDGEWILQFSDDNRTWIAPAPLSIGSETSSKEEAAVLNIAHGLIHNGSTSIYEAFGHLSDETLELVFAALAYAAGPRPSSGILSSLEDRIQATIGAPTRDELTEAP